MTASQRATRHDTRGATPTTTQRSYPHSADVRYLHLRPHLVSPLRIGSECSTRQDHGCMRASDLRPSDVSEGCAHAALDSLCPCAPAPPAKLPPLPPPCPSSSARLCFSVGLRIGASSYQIRHLLAKRRVVSSRAHSSLPPPALAPWPLNERPCAGPPTRSGPSRTPSLRGRGASRSPPP